MNKSSTRQKRGRSANSVNAESSRADIKHTDSFPIVGVGASAGGFEAFTALLKGLPEEIRIAFVLVQHLDPTHDSVLPEILSRVTRLPISQVTDGMVVEARHIYVIPENTTMVIRDGALRLGARVLTHGQHMPIDEFLRSLADECGNRAVGVILSGTASDGTEGCRAIKAAGGITFAQEESTAKFSGMPHSAIASGCIDFVLEPAAIAKELVRISNHPYLVRPTSSAEVPTDLGEPTELAGLLKLLQESSGVDFGLYKRTTMQRRIGRRMVVHHLENISDYHRYVQEHPEELTELYRDILIHVTEFFRDPHAFEALREHVLPKILQNRKVDKHPIRIWVPGCSTGEEVYSIAIMVLEYLWETRAVPQGSITTSSLQIFATDISESALDRARSGLYSHAVVAQVSDDRLRRFFLRLDGGYQINKALRELCIFAKQNVTRDPPFSNLDLISCRNLLIYLGSALQNRVIPTFHYALKPDGFLLLGGSESLGSFADHFLLIDKKQKIYQKKKGSARLLSYFAATPYSLRGPEGQHQRSPVSGFSVEKEVERVLLGRYIPASIVVNSDMEIIQFRGRTGAYLEPAEGRANFSLSKMVRDGLIVDVRAAIDLARKQNRTVRSDGIQLKHNGSTKQINLDVIPIQGQSADERYYVVVFHEVEPLRVESRAKRQTQGQLAARDSRLQREIQRLNRELEQAKQQIRSLIEDNESTGEEYKSANEEVLSANEELQSTNEELETAKEELQSSNEELTTLNEELQNRNAELTLANSDLTNLLGNVSIPLVMVGNDLRIRRFTPPAQKLLNLLPGDIGRRLGEIRPNLDFEDLEHMVREAIENTALQEREVRERDGRWHALRVRPYRTWDNKIEGAVISLQDIDKLKQSLEETRMYADALIESAREPILILDKNLRVTIGNPAFYAHFGGPAENVEGQLLFEVGNGEWNIPELRKLLELAAKEDRRVDDFIVQRDFARLGRRTLVINARQMEFQPNRLLTLLAIEDVTDQEQQVESMKQQAALIQLAHETILVREMDGKIRFWNRGAEQMYGWTAKQALGKVIHELLDTKYPKPLKEIFEELTRTGHWEGELLHTRADGARRIVTSRWAIQEGRGDAVILEINSDVTQRSESEKNLRDLSAYLLTLQDEERRRIARELHDSTGQDLAAIKMQLGTVVDEHNSNPKMQKAVRESVDIVEKVTRDIRTLAQLLHPPLLDEAGLILATKSLIDGFQDRGNIPIEFKAPTDMPRLPANVEIALFRIIQEALTNIHRHSGATRGSVELLRPPDRIELRIKDDGKGVHRDGEFASDGRKPMFGVGILGMKERMKQLGGILEIESGHQGTLVKASLRVAESRPQPAKAAN